MWTEVPNIWIDIWHVSRYNINMKNEIKPREYVIQPNAISQAIYSAGTNARRLMAMAMSLLPEDPKTDKDFTVSFEVTDFMKALGMESGNKTRILVQSALEEAMGSLIKILDDQTGDYILYTWFRKSRLARIHPKLESEWAWGWGTITMTFNPELAAAIGDFRRQYALINLMDFGKLQSRYAIRIYEMALSYGGFAGRDGNRPGHWWFAHDLKEIRALFDIEKNKYKTTSDFRKRIIDIPIEEINAADIGIRIEPEYIRRGKWLYAIRFNCRWVDRSEPVQVRPATQAGQENEELINKYPEEYEELKAKALAEYDQNPPLLDTPNRREMETGNKAIEWLKERYPEKKRAKRGNKG